MKTIQSILLILTFGPIFNSCKKENVSHFGVSESFQCENFDWTLPPGSTFVEYSEDSIQCKFPTVNPENEFEIVYMKQNLLDLTFQLIKYNYLTRQKTVLVDDVLLINQPSWNSNGNIAYEVYGNKIYIVSDNGMNNVPFAINDGNMQPCWSPDNVNLIWTHTNTSSPETMLFRRNIFTSNVDTLFQSFGGKFTISNGNKLLISSGNSFYSLNLNIGTSFTASDLSLITNQSLGSTVGFCWHPDGTKFYVSKFFGQDYSNMGLFEIELATGSQTKILDYFDKRRYESIVCSPDGKSIIGQRVDCYQKLDNQGDFTGEVFQNSSIYKINLQTLKELKISP